MKKKTVVFLLVMALLSGCGTKTAPEETKPAETVPVETVPAVTAPAETVSEETVSADRQIMEEHLELYRPVLEQYTKALTEEWSGEQYAAADLSTQAFRYTRSAEDLEYSLQDLDGDGTAELLISLHNNSFVMDVYRLNNGEPERLFASINYVDVTGAESGPFLWDEWYLCREENGEFFFYHQLQKDWLISGYYRVVLEQGQLRITESFLYNSIVDADNPWYRVDGLVLDYTQGEPISHDEAGMTLYGYEAAKISAKALEHSWLLSDFS